MASFVARMVSAFEALADALVAQTGVEVAVEGTAGNQLSVSWTAPEDNGGADITGYVVQWKSGDEEYDAERQASTSDLSWNTPAGLTKGTVYTFRVAAINSAGQGEFSSEASGSPGVAPGLVGNLRSVPGNGTLVLSWTAPAEDGGTPITGYVVSWRTGRAATAETEEIDDGTATSYTITGLTNSRNYSVWVQAVNDAGTGESAMVPAGNNNVQVTPAPTKASAPQNLTATPVAAGRALDVSWTAPADDGGTVLLGYSLESRCGSATTWTPHLQSPQPNVPTSQIQTAQLTGLTNGDGCEIRVRANSYNDANNNTQQDGTPDDDANPERTLQSDWAEISATPVTLPMPPTTPTGGVVNRGHESLQLTWGAPTSDGGSDITGYEITWSAGRPSEATVPAEPRSYTITGLDNRYQYAITIKSVTAIGKSETALTVSASTGTQPRAVPAAPTGVKAEFADLTLPRTASQRRNNEPASPNPDAGTSLKISWAQPPGNGTNAVTGYVVQQRTSFVPAATPEGTPTPPGDWGVTSGTVNVATRTLVATGLTNGTSYDFRVQATNDHDDDATNADEGGLWSVFVSGTPTTLPGAVTTASGIEIVGGDRSLTVSWPAPASDGGSDITEYIIKHAIRTGGPFTSTTVQSPRTRITLRNLSNGVEYLVQIQAKNVRGAGPIYDTLNQTNPDEQGVSEVPVARANAPTSVKAMPKENGDGTRITVSWNLIPASGRNGQGPITSYQIQTRTIATDGTIGNWTTATSYDVDAEANANALSSISATTTSVDIESIDGTKYEVRVRGNSQRQGSWGYIVGTVTAAGTPAAPTNVAAAIDPVVNTTINVSWDSVAAAQSATSDITGYLVSWYNPSNLLTGDRGSMNVSGNTVGKFSIVGLSPGNTYQVIVSAVNDVGNSAGTSVTVTVPRA